MKKVLGLTLVALLFGGTVSSADSPEFIPEEKEATNGYWHCTAYAQGHGHSWGYDYTDVHYSHAYYGAMHRCESITHHHCHDVHCHYDHH